MECESFLKRDLDLEFLTSPNLYIARENIISGWLLFRIVNFLQRPSVDDESHIDVVLGGHDRKDKAMSSCGSLLFRPVGSKPKCESMYRKSE